MQLPEDDVIVPVAVVISRKMESFRGEWRSLTRTGSGGNRSSHRTTSSSDGCD